MVGDFYSDKWKQPNIQPNPIFPSKPPVSIQDLLQFPSPTISREEFESLKREVLEMKELLKRAVDYDKRNNEPHCEMEEKVALLKKVAEYVGVTLEDVFPKNK
jgi:hypothetical protein